MSIASLSASARGWSCMAVGTRIIQTNGDPVDFVTGVVLRAWVLNFVAGILNQCCLG